jgi:hypothetical protein
MNAVSDGFKVRLEMVLDQVFGSREHGGDHDARAYVAARLLDAAATGTTDLADLIALATSALDELGERPRKQGE